MGLINVIKKILIDSSETEKKPPELQKIGIEEAVCPYCGVELKKKPTRKKKCPDCNNYIFVRTSPLDKSKILITEDEIDLIEEQWAIYNGTYDDYLDQKKKFECDREKLTKKFGSTASENDVKWSLLNEELLSNVKNGDWGLYRNTKFALAKILVKEERYKDALLLYLEICYLDLNGPNNTGGMKDSHFPPFSIDMAFLAPGIVKKTSKMIKVLNLDKTEVENLFFRISNKLEKNLKLPVSPKKVWVRISNELSY